MQVFKNITIPSNDSIDPFWIMSITICVHVLQASLLDGWKTSMKHDMLSFVDIGMKGFNKGVGFTMRVYFLRI